MLHVSSLWKGLALLTGMGLMGCSTTELPPYQAQTFDTYQFSASNKGLTIALHPLTDKVESEKYFGKDLLAANILAGFLVVENRSPTSTFLLSNEKIQLESSKTGGRSEDIGDTTAGEIGVGVVTAGALLIAPAALVLLPLAGILVSQANEVHHNYLAKEFQTQTLAAGEKTEGFVYFQLPEKKEDWPEQWTLYIESFDVKSKDNISLAIPFSWRSE